MSSIGFRCYPKGFAYVVLSGTKNEPAIVDFGKYPFPIGFSESEKLSWMKKKVEEILNKHTFETAALKRPELMTRSNKSFYERAIIEGVVIETVYSTYQIDCEGLLKCQLKSRIKPFKSTEEALAERGLEGLGNTEIREAAIAALAVLGD